MSRLPYSYRAMLTHDECLSKRAVTFRDGRFLDWWQLGKEVFKYFTSQNCARCGQKHNDDEYVMTDAELGEPDQTGFYRYKYMRPSNPDPNQMELPYDNYSVGR